MNTSSDCCSHSESGRALVDACTFWVEGVVTFCVGSFGILGNLLSISVLMGKEMRNNAFNHLLIILATVDSFLITFALLDKSLIKAFNLEVGDVYNYMFPYFLYPTTNIVLCYSIFLVLSIAFERYLAVCHPYEYRAISSTQSVTTRVLKLTLPVFVLAVIINVPKFFETELAEVSDPNSPNRTQLTVVVTDLRKNPDYINYYVNWFSLLGTGVLPMAVLVFLNVSIYVKIAATRKKMTHQPLQQQPRRTAEAIGRVDSSNKKEHEVSKRDIRMAMILITIVLVFFSCHLPRVLLNLHEFFMVSRMISCGAAKFCPPIWFLCSITFSHLLLVVNSSVNIFIYCSVGEKFREGLKNQLHLHHLPRIPFLFSPSTSSGGLNNGGNVMAMNATTLVYEANEGKTVVRLEPRREVSLAKFDQVIAAAVDRNCCDTLQQTHVE